MIIRDSGPGQLEDLRITLKADGQRTFVAVEDQNFDDFRIPFSREEVESALADLVPNRLSTDPLVSFGSTLFSALFSGELGRTLWERLAQVEQSNRALRLRIVSNLERTQHLPWELLFDPSRGDFMSLSGRVALVRTRPENLDHPTLEPLTSLRILAVAADPTNAMRTGDDLSILHSLAQADPRVTLTILDQATPETLDEALSKGPFDIFHFAGSGEVLHFESKRVGGGLRQALRLMGPASTGALFDRQELGEMLEHAKVRLAVLNACHTDWITRSLAKYIPSALGLRDNVTVESCLTLCRSLYRSILAGTPLDLAMTAARQAVDRAQPGTGDWCKLIFYLQQPNGRFLTSADAPADTATKSPSRASGSREVARLTRLLDIYQANLAALERSAASAPGAEAFREQSVTLKQKVAAVKQELAEVMERESR